MENINVFFLLPGPDCCTMKYLNYNINRLLIHITGMLVLIAFTISFLVFMAAILKFLTPGLALELVSAHWNM